jgi:hypothetical protein
MELDSDGGTWCQAPRLKVGWQLWLGTGWVEITSLRVEVRHVLIGAADGKTYRAAYTDAVRCRAAVLDEHVPRPPTGGPTRSPPGKARVARNARPAGRRGRGSGGQGCRS